MRKTEQVKMNMHAHPTDGQAQTEGQGANRNRCGQTVRPRPTDSHVNRRADGQTEGRTDVKADTHALMRVTSLATAHNNYSLCKTERKRQVSRKLRNEGSRLHTLIDSLGGRPD